MANEAGGSVNGDGAEPADQQNAGEQSTVGPADDAWEPDWDQPEIPYERPRPHVVGGEEVDDGSGNGSGRAANSIFKPPPKHFAPFPQSAWRGLFYQYAAVVAQTTEASEAAIWGAHAAALSVVLGRECSLPWAGGGLFPTLHVAILGPTGSGRKSSSIDDAQVLLVDPFKPKATLPGEPDPLVVLSGMGSGEGFMEAIKDTHWLPPGAKRGTQSNVQTGRRALFVISELGGLLEKANAGAAGSMIDFVINAWDCKREWTHQVRRTKDTAPFKATDATAVILAASTMEWLSEVLTIGHIRNGLVNRFLWLAGDPRGAIAIRPPFDPIAVHAYQQMASNVLARVRGQQFSLDQAATGLHKAKYADIYSSRLHADPDSTTIPATNRAEIQALRLAILIAAADGTTTIDLSILQAAWDIVEYSNHIVEVLTGALIPRTVGDMERRIMKQCLRSSKAHNGEFSRYMVWERVKGKGGVTVEIFGKIWDALVREGDIIAIGARGSRKTPHFQTARPLLEALDAGALDS